MDKYKLFKLESSLKFEAIKKSLLISKNVIDTSFEIKPTRITDNELCFKFSEKKLMETYLLDINGNEQLIEYLQVDSFEFEIISKNDSLFLLILNSPKSLKAFKQMLAEILYYEISITDILVNPIEWIENIEKSGDYFFDIRSLEIKDIIFNSKTNGSMTLKSQIDIRDSYETNIKSDNYKICKALILNNDYFKGRFILSKDGSFQLDCMNSKVLIDQLISNL